MKPFTFTVLCFEAHLFVFYFLGWWADIPIYSCKQATLINHLNSLSLWLSSRYLKLPLFAFPLSWWYTIKTPWVSSLLKPVVPHAPPCALCSLPLQSFFSWADGFFLFATSIFHQAGGFTSFPPQATLHAPTPLSPPFNASMDNPMCDTANTIIGCWIEWMDFWQCPTNSNSTLYIIPFVSVQQPKLTRLF